MVARLWLFPPALQDELCVLSTTFLLAVADLRAEFLPMISATDASVECLGAVRAALTVCR